ncbi:hypothetical protein [Streptomyces olivaceus]|uniref:hypothetical protein n=1 Tax=Streptomyces olivaceus TaxID=47716 RepID=UPI001CCC465B|nr:hypothetical protein [Streptomyces olivaceus]MBZ6139989.1 hypothetical protein [Streptomyces olivaceus]MBZ6166106.1 hypothetical protein [Streptomyces olivaceus]
MRPEHDTAPAHRAARARRGTPPLRPAPGTAPHRTAATALGVLLAVLLALVPAWPTAGAQAAPQTGGAAPVAAGAAVPHPDLDLHADDGCTPVCASPVRARHDHLGERPTAPDHHAAAAARGTGTAARILTRTSAAPGPVLVSPGRASHDSGRAPPGPSGT